MTPDVTEDAADDGDHHPCDLRAGSDHKANAIHALRHRAIGMELHEQGRFDEALKEYYAAEKLDPHNPNTLCDIGRAYLSLKRPKKALAAFGIVLKKEPNNVQALIGKADTHGLLGDHDKALECFMVVTRLNPKHLRAQAGVGRSLVSLGLHNEALGVLARNTELEPGSAVVHVDMARALSLLGRHQEALDAIDRALKLRPNDINIHLERSSVLSALGRHVDARVSLNRAISPSSSCTDPQLCRTHEPRMADACCMTPNSLERPDIYPKHNARDRDSLPATTAQSLEPSKARVLDKRTRSLFYNILNYLYSHVSVHGPRLVSTLIRFVISLLESHNT